MQAYSAQRPRHSRSATSGLRLATLLRGAWRQSTAPLPAQFDLESTLALLLRSGAAPLAWWRIKDQADLASSAAGEILRNAYRLSTLDAVLQAPQIPRALDVLESVGAQPLVAKGWAIARKYPQPGLRPFGDIDIFVAPARYAAASETIQNLPKSGLPVDLHRGVPDLSDRSWPELYARSLLAPAGHQQAVRILGNEDHLRFLCLHAVRHGVRRPLWLCDIGVAVEELQPAFDWQYFVGGDPWRTAAAGAILRLSRSLLGANVHDPGDHLSGRLTAPDWVRQSVLDAWGTPFAADYSRPMVDALGHPPMMLQALRERWPNQLQLSYQWRLPFNSWPRWPFQAASFSIQSLTWLPHLLRWRPRPTRRAPW